MHEMSIDLDEDILDVYETLITTNRKVLSLDGDIKALFNQKVISSQFLDQSTQLIQTDN